MNLFAVFAPPPLVVLAAYWLGCFNTGYYLVRWKCGRDLRSSGSGNAGAKNVGRLLGPWGFGVALFGDMLKGIFAVLLAQLDGCDARSCTWVILAVVVGHDWPAQLGFRGGKGVATSFGALLIFNPLLAGLMLALCAALLAATRRFTLSAISAYTFCPVLALLCGLDRAVALLLVPLAVVVVLPHLRGLGREIPSITAQP